MEAKHLKAVVAFVAAKKSPILRGILVDFDNRRLVATDSSAIIVVDLDESDMYGTGKVVVPVEYFEKAIKEAGKQSIIISNEKIGNVAYEAKELETPDGYRNFPRYERVLPTEEEELDDQNFCMYKSKYLKMMENTIEAFGGDVEVDSIVKTGALYARGAERGYSTTRLWEIVIMPFMYKKRNHR